MPGKRHLSRKEKRLQKRLKRLHKQLGDDDEESTDAVQKPGADPNVGGRGISTKVEDTGEEESGEELDGSGTYDGGFDGDEETSEESDDEDHSAVAGDDEGVGGQDAGEDDEDGGSDEADEGVEVEEDDGDDDDEAAEDDGSASEARGQGGMAEKMAIILGQRVTRKTPVLAKRKTKLMKDMEDQKKAAKREREAAAQKRAALNHQLFIPDHTHTEPERQLRRIATRGVVALFNAVTKARAAQAAEGADAKVQGKTGKAGEMSKKQFLEMLKSSTSKSSGVAKDSTTSTKASAAKLSAVAPPRTVEARSWAALDDGLMMEKAPKMNAFDNEDDLVAGMDDVDYPDDAEKYDVDGDESFGEEEDGRDRRKAPSAAVSKSIKGKSKLKKVEMTRRARK